MVSAMKEQTGEVTEVTAGRVMGQEALSEKKPLT